jgi:hypothetical protein
MPLPATINQATLDTVIGRLALLFITGAAGDLIAASQAASQMLGAYNVETNEELRLAAEIVSFSFHALEALSQTDDPDLSLNRKLRLRGSAVSLSRESHKSQRKLDALQRARRAGIPTAGIPAQAQPTNRPKVDNALAHVEETRQAATHAAPKISWSQSLQKRLTAKRMAEKQKKAQHATQAGRLNPAPIAAHPN